MKKLINNTNPFVLLLAPLVFALIMGVSYQFEQKKQNDSLAASAVKATSLFAKGVGFIKTVASVKKDNVW
ncbi:hypothetical protein [Mucilaginibacter auburnensis]|uniref:Uncharacterized protein n=1 Tax=Mucilaginibacter auburnensis TaxID=1457233 RepID=A0A2H9VPJ9_9SPHI|nr:hypothetical protein [Mucilaginibacter auburnensis]PJJ80268.1 hypothetical protein CLV57_3417 [Mucilaginibacter auburnensis]